MNNQSISRSLRRASSLVVLALLACTTLPVLAQTAPVALTCPVNTPFRFAAYGDTRFTDPGDTKATNPEIRRDLIQAMADANPAFISIGGDIAYNGNNPDDWKVYDQETAIWRQRKIPVYPALGNHDLHGDPKVALANYFERFPELKESRYYSVHCANTLMLVLDSSLDELSGPQGDWLKSQLDHLDSNIDFVTMVLHHPPYTSSKDKTVGGGHSSRPTEQALAKKLEQRQQSTRARFVVFAGHVHNYERHEHGGVTYFVTGGGGAHPVPIQHTAQDPFQDGGVNYHYLLVEVDKGALTVTMNRITLEDDGKPKWTQPDTVRIAAPAARAAQTATAR